MKKLVKTLSIIVIVGLLSVSMFACGGKTDENKITTAKPSYTTLTNNYESATQKKATLSLDAYVKIHGNGETFYQVGGEANVVRIQNNDKLYMTGRANGKCSANIKDLLKSGKTLSAFFGETEEDKQNMEDFIDSMIYYLDGTFFVEGKLGYNGDTAKDYNLKTEMFEHFKLDASGNPIKDSNGNFTFAEPTKDWWGINTAEFDSFYDDMYDNYNIDLSKYFGETRESFDLTKTLKEYMMYSSLMNYDDMAIDKANKMYNNTTKAYEYLMYIQESAFMDWGLDMVDDMLSTMGVEDWSTNIVQAEKAVDIIKGWVTLGDSVVESKANTDNLPTYSKTSFNVKVNIDATELIELAEIFIAEEDMGSIRGAINLASLMMFKGVNGESGKIGMEFFVDIEESYAYDDASCDLSSANKNIDQSLFLTTTDTANDGEREVIKHIKDLSWTEVK